VESIALNKPILVIPQRGQWEQQLNAEMVEKTLKGKSTTVERLGADLPEFKLHIERYRSSRVPSRFMTSDDRQSILRRIESFLRIARASHTRRASRVPLPLRANGL
ncbi:MAG TPA: hypothetical protein VMM82_01015, partial [Spirochaetia bacterium]|nr:hypothetical protein [Spirochaetia bacterium]